MGRWGRDGRDIGEIGGVGDIGDIGGIEGNKRMRNEKCKMNENRGIRGRKVSGHKGKEGMGWRFRVFFYVLHGEHGGKDYFFTSGGRRIQ